MQALTCFLDECKVYDESVAGRILDNPNRFQWEFEMMQLSKWVKSNPNMFASQFYQLDAVNQVELAIRSAWDGESEVTERQLFDSWQDDGMMSSEYA